MTGKRLTPVARRLTRQRTDAEMLLWSRLRGRRLDGYKFVEQCPIGPHVADFACRKARLVVELDGGQYATSVDADAECTRVIESFGYAVIRFWNNDVLENTDGVLEAILCQLRLGAGEEAAVSSQAPSPLTPTLSPLGRGS
jgi:very-short-patch-repair endonuclease